ncbi:MAG TPA: bifunctional tetrahydrofolate synthase/dihydrofolate synthase [Chromatiaceae bacterium]|nr:bifunctional tetrahydrofolate synthase/dihydrofolate synthase [Chromatiaceae bacterium]
MRFATLDGWLDWQSGLHPAAIDLGLERVAGVWRQLGGQLACPVVTVAGTNGKGSSVAMLEAIWRAAGYRTASFTSPHLHRYNERIQLHGEPVEDGVIIEAFERIDRARGAISLTYFEFGTLAALDIFSRAEVDVVILETGLGGRLDAVNIIDADVALITAIGIDHVDWLGHDRGQIALEKAGILRRGRAAVCSDPRPPASLLDRAAELGAPLSIYQRDFSAEIAPAGWQWRMGDRLRNSLPMPALRGDYQIQNAAGVLAVIESMEARLPVSQNAIRDGLAGVALAGRFEVIPGRPTIILDVAHNAQAAGVLRDTLANYHCKGRVLGVFSALRDKQLDEILGVMDASIDRWYPAGLDDPRGLTGGAIAGLLEAHVEGDRAPAREHIAEALNDARQDAGENDCIIVFGSFLSVAEARQTLEN